MLFPSSHAHLHASPNPDQGMGPRRSSAPSSPASARCRCPPRGHRRSTRTTAPGCRRTTPTTSSSGGCAPFDPAVPAVPQVSFDTRLSHSHTSHGWHRLTSSSPPRHRSINLTDGLYFYPCSGREVGKLVCKRAQSQWHGSLICDDTSLSHARVCVRRPARDRWRTTSRSTRTSSTSSSRPCGAPPPPPRPPSSGAQCARVCLFVLLDAVPHSSCL